MTGQGPGLTVPSPGPSGPWLVTGAAGFIGFHTCKRLLDQGIEVIGVDAMSSYYDPHLKAVRLDTLRAYSDFSFHQIDCANDDAMGLLAAQRRPRVVVHLAAQAGIRFALQQPNAYLHSNLVAFGVVLEMCRQQQVEHLVYASSSSVYGTTGRIPFDVHDPADHPTSLYAAIKRSNELMAHSYSHLFDLPTTGLRLFTVYGPWGRPDMAYYAFADAILAGRPLTLHGDGSVIRDFTYIDDVVEAVVRIGHMPARPNPTWSDTAPDPASSTAPFRLYNVGHGGQASLLDLINLLEELTGKSAAVQRVGIAAGDMARTLARTAELEAQIDFCPPTSLRDGMSKFVAWLSAHRSGRSVT